MSVEHGEGDRGFGKSGQCQWNMERVIEALENQVSGTWGG